jgi:hypothetical protein
MTYLKSLLILGATCCFTTISASALAEEPVAEGPRRVEAEPRPEPPAEEDPSLVEASPVRKNIGIALTSVGIVNMTAGTTMLLYSFFGGGLGYGGVIIGAPIHFEGTVLMSVGVPLWVTGSQRVPAGARAPAKPEMSFGPGTASATWTF